MTSARKIKSNRTNAKASTGAKSAQGKARAAQNARRHGLSISVFSDPLLSEEVRSLAQDIAGETVDREVVKLARGVAEAQIDLNRIRQARHKLLVRHTDDPDLPEGPKKKRLFARTCRCNSS
jgi:hypothetical protein